MLLRRILCLVVIAISAVTPGLGQEYPYIHYTPKDGLVNSRIRAVYQDTRGRLFFMTTNGLSIYDGARFSNYTTKDGLGDPIVNDVVEITPDSLLIASNTSQLHAWVRGKIVRVLTSNNFCPVINRFFRTTYGRIFMATDQGLYFLDHNKCVHVEIPDTAYKKTGLLLDNILQIGNRLVLKGSIDIACPGGLYLYDLTTKKLDTFVTQPFHSIVALRNKNLLLAFAYRSIFAFDLDAASKGRLLSRPLPHSLHSLVGTYSNAAHVDEDGNLWCSLFSSVSRTDSNGNELILDKTSGLSVNNISNVFIDKEKILWIMTDGSGLFKLVNKNLEIVTGLFGKSSSGISALYATEKTDTAWMYNFEDQTIYGISANRKFSYKLDTMLMVSRIFPMQKGFYLTDDRGIYFVKINNRLSSRFQVQRVYQDSLNLNYNKAIIDGNGTIFVSGIYLLAWKSPKVKFVVPLKDYSDQIALDKYHQLWVTTRAGELMCFTVNPSQPEKFLTLKYNYKNVIPKISPRSLAVDSSNNVWVGTRYDGLYMFRFNGNQLTVQRHFTTDDGLTDNFVYYLAISRGNTIWVGTQGGLDKVNSENRRFNVQGITRTNNVFEFIHSIAISADHKVWFRGASGSTMRVNDIEEREQLRFKPSLQIVSIKAGDTSISVPTNNYVFDHKQNNISIQVAAPSFIDEKQVLYSYLLQGAGLGKWSTPSRAANFDFMNLRPGKYTLQVKAFFPVPQYQPQEIAYSFSITPPWWQTMLFKIATAIVIIIALLLILRAYVHRKLEKQRMALEKVQAIEKERTRIASDMHDDLGAGLSTIRFLGEKINRRINTLTDRTDIEKIVSNSNELVQKMNEIIWAMNEKNDSLEDLLFYTRSYAVEYCEENNLVCHVALPDSLPERFVSGEIRRNVFLMVKEGLHNVVKHAEASKVEIVFEITNNLRVTIRDNGKGLKKSNGGGGGNGLMNMKKRMQMLGGQLQMNNGLGLTLTFEVPLN